MKETGFTLIELILYLALIAIFLSALMPFTGAMVSTSAKSATEQEVFSNARLLSERLKYEIRDASGINLVTATSISLSNSLGSKNPTVIDLSAGKMRIKYGVGAVTNLNSTDTSVSSLVFTNYTSVDTKTKNIGWVFTLQSNFNTARQEYQATTTIEGNAEIRSN